MEAISYLNRREKVSESEKLILAIFIKRLRDSRVCHCVCQQNDEKWSRKIQIMIKSALNVIFLASEWHTFECLLEAVLLLVSLQPK